MHLPDLPREFVKNGFPFCCVLTRAQKIVHRYFTRCRRSKDKRKILPKEPALLPKGHWFRHGHSGALQGEGVFPLHARLRPDFAAREKRVEPILLVRAPIAFEKQGGTNGLLGRGYAGYPLNVPLAFMV